MISAGSTVDGIFKSVPSVSNDMKETLKADLVEQFSMF